MARWKGGDGVVLAVLRNKNIWRGHLVYDDGYTQFVDIDKLRLKNRFPKEALPKLSFLRKRSGGLETKPREFFDWEGSPSSAFYRLDEITTGDLLLTHHRRSANGATVVRPVDTTRYLYHHMGQQVSGLRERFYNLVSNVEEAVLVAHNDAYVRPDSFGVPGPYASIVGPTAEHPEAIAHDAISGRHWRYPLRPGQRTPSPQDAGWRIGQDRMSPARYRQELGKRSRSNPRIEGDRWFVELSTDGEAT